MYYEIRSNGWIPFRATHPVARPYLMESRLYWSLSCILLERVFFVYPPNRLNFKKSLPGIPFAMVLVDLELEHINMFPKNIAIILATFKSSEFTFLVLRQGSITTNQAPLPPFEEAQVIDPQILPSAPEVSEGDH